MSENCNANNLPAEIEVAAENAVRNLLPTKSRLLYEKAYNEFLKWCEEKQVKEYSEKVLLAYFSEKSSTYKPSTLWSHYSMIRTSLSINKNININTFPKLIAFLKRTTDGFKPKKSKVLSRENIIKFIREAPDKDYLMIKVEINLLLNKLH